MKFRVTVLPAAKRRASENALWWATHRSAEQAGRWLDGLDRAIESLETTATRHPLAAESERFPFDLRQLNYGLGSRPTHRVLYEIRGDEVLVLTVRHLAQRELNPEDLAE